MTLKRISLLGSTAAALCGLSAYAVDITIADPHANQGFGSNPTGTLGENDEVEKRGAGGISALTGQDWDLEHFDLNVTIGANNAVTSAKLGMTAGFNFDVGNGAYEAGDIFVYLGPQVPYTVNAGDGYAGGNGPTDWVGKNDWDYVIRFERDFPDTSTGAEDGPDFKITGAAGSQTVKYQIMTKAAAFANEQYTGEGSALLTGLPLRIDERNGNTFSSTGTANYSTTGSGSGFHNTVDNIDITSITTFMQANNITTGFLHTTLACGNDVMWGGPQITSLSIPAADGGATLLLMGAGLTGLWLVRRRQS